MTGYIGTLANLKPLLPTTAVSVETPDRYAIQEAPARRWAFVAYKGAKLRTWKVDTNMLTSGEVGGLAELLDGGFGYEPLVFVPCPVHDSNVLTPAQSMLSGVANGGGMETPAGFSPVSVVGGARTTIADRVPIVPGMPVSASIYATGASVSLIVTFKTATGGVVASRSVSGSYTSAGRVVVSVESVPVTARYITVEVSGFTAAARPAVSWTVEPTPWVSGGGSSSVIVQNGEFSVETTSFSDSSVQIIEVG